MIGTYNGRLSFKSSQQEKEYERLDYRLRFLVDVAVQWSSSKTAPVVIVTSVYRDSTTSVHGDYRGIDLRIHPLGLNKWVEFAEWVNNHVDYGRGYVPALIGHFDPKGKHNDHIHLQVPGPYQAKGKLRLYAAPVAKPSKSNKTNKPTKKDKKDELDKARIS